MILTLWRHARGGGWGYNGTWAQRSQGWSNQHWHYWNSKWGGEGLYLCLIIILPSDCTVSFFTLGKNNLGRNKDIQRTMQETKVIFWHVEIAISIRERKKMLYYKWWQASTSRHHFNEISCWFAEAEMTENINPTSGWD